MWFFKRDRIPQTFAAGEDLQQSTFVFGQVVAVKLFGVESRGAEMMIVQNRILDTSLRNVARGQIEVLGGAFYEPILAGIPRRDRVGQIAAFSHHLKNTFGTDIRGMWVPERVWEQGLTSDLASAGMRAVSPPPCH